MTTHTLTLAETIAATELLDADMTERLATGLDGRVELNERTCEAREVPKWPFRDMKAEVSRALIGSGWRSSASTSTDPQKIARLLVMAGWRRAVSG